MTKTSVSNCKSAWDYTKCMLSTQINSFYNYLQLCTYTQQCIASLAVRINLLQTAIILVCFSCDRWWIDILILLLPFDSIWSVIIMWPFWNYRFAVQLCYWWFFVTISTFVRSFVRSKMNCTRSYRIRGTALVKPNRILISSTPNLIYFLDLSI